MDGALLAATYSSDLSDGGARIPTETVDLSCLAAVYSHEQARGQRRRFRARDSADHM